jgi:hypothetical protein
LNSMRLFRILSFFIFLVLELLPDSLHCADVNPYIEVVIIQCLS